MPPRLILTCTPGGKRCDYSFLSANEQTETRTGEGSLWAPGQRKSAERNPDPAPRCVAFTLPRSAASRPVSQAEGLQAEERGPRAHSSTLPQREIVKMITVTKREPSLGAEDIATE